MDLNQHQRNTQKQLGLNTGSPRTLIGGIFAFAGSAVLIILGFTFSLLILAVAAAVGILGFGYLWWRTRALRRQLREQMTTAAQAGWRAEDNDDLNTGVGGTVIEGEVIDEERAAPK
jgi:Flp pilus assembly protein TadB